MSDNEQSTEQKKSGLRRKFRRPLDFLIILIFLFGAAFSFNQFRLDIQGNEKPVGSIIISNNVVQQRMANRNLWDRLDADSPVYSGDQIRTAGLSNATLLIERNSIDLNEKTVIRIQRSTDDEDSIIISLDEGNLVITTAPGGGNIALNIMGRMVEAGPLTVLSASVGKDGAIVQVSEGTATLVEGRQRREISSGRMIALDSGGVEQLIKAAVVQQPRPDARYLKNGPEPLFVNFAWNRINLDTGEALCLEIAEDRNFNRIIQVIKNLDTSAVVALNTGSWYWRLSLTSPGMAAAAAVLSTGRLSVADDVAMVLPAPVLPEPVIERPETVTLLPAPLNRLPLTGHRIGIEQLRESEGIVFTWSAVQGANAYIFTLYQGSGNGRRQIIRVPPENRRSWTLENVAALDRGTFFWQVEAVNMSSAGTIERRGNIVENSFIIDIPRSGNVQMENPGTLYGD